MTTALTRTGTGTALVRMPRAAERRTLLDRALRRDRMGFVHAGVISVFIGGGVVAGSIYFELVSDRVLPHQSVTTLWMLFAGIVLMLSLGTYLSRQRDHVLERIGLRLDAALRPALFETFIRSRFDPRTENAATGLDDLDTLKGFLSGRGLSALYDLAPVPAYIAICFAIHAALGLFVSVLFAAAAVLGVLIVSLRLRHESVARAGRPAEPERLLGAFANIEAVQALGMRQAFQQRWLGHHREVLAAEARAEDRLAPLTTALGFVLAAAGGLTVAVGAYFGILGQVTAGNVIGAMLLAGRMVQPVGVLTAEWRSFLRARQAHDRLQVLFRSAQEVRHAGGTLRDAPKADLAVDDLAMAAPGGTRFILSQVSFSVPAGSAMGVIGPSGAGKSTLVRALVGIWPPTHGSVRLDGSELHHWDADQLGLHLGYLPQNVELLSGTIAENIARFGAIDDEAVLDAARLAGVHDVIQGLPQGYNTQVGEGGSALSGGQRQRVGLARALYGKPALVVLDEPNSNLDALGEGALAEALKAMKERGTTCILVTHKANILKMVDLVLVLKDGTMSAFGPRDTILAPAGVPSIAPPPPSQPIAAPRADTGDAA